MSKSKCSVLVISEKGQSFTTRRGARRMVEANLARPESERCIRMIEDHPRFEAQPLPSRPTSPRLAVRARVFEMGGDYRNEFLGLPNFVRTGAPRSSSHGKKAA